MRKGRRGSSYGNLGSVRLSALAASSTAEIARRHRISSVTASNRCWALLSVRAT